MEDKNDDEELLVNAIRKEIEFSSSIEEFGKPSTPKESKSIQQIHSKISMWHLQDLFNNTSF
jgi:hypothetical protein